MKRRTVPPRQLTFGQLLHTVGFLTMCPITHRWTVQDASGLTLRTLQHLAGPDVLPAKLLLAAQGVIPAARSIHPNGSEPEALSYELSRDEVRR